MININSFQVTHPVQRIKPTGMLTVICHVDGGEASVNT